MRRSLPWVSAFFLSASFCSAAETSPAPGSSTTRQGTRSTETSKKTSGTTAPVVSESTKKKSASGSKSTAGAGEKLKTEDERFAAARKAAAEDPKVVELREKADAAKNDESAGRLVRSYLRALYGKMRTLEPSLEERINLTEAAALKAVGKPE